MIGRSRADHSTECARGPRAEASFSEPCRAIKAIKALLQNLSGAEAEVLEVGRNECAVVSRPQ